MSVPRLYLDRKIQIGTEVELSGNRARYIGRVLRLRDGDQVALFDGSGREYLANILRITKSSATLEVVEATDRDTESPLSVHLLQGLSRGERMDFVVQKATELGVDRITPIRTEYSVVRLTGERAEKRVEHWRGVAASACEQCGRNRLPTINPIVDLRDWLGEHFSEPGARIALRPGGERVLRTLDLTDNAITACIGPEGGFSDDEYERLAAANFQFAGLGPRVLRTETAAVALLAALQTLFGDFE